MRTAGLIFLVLGGSVSAAPCVPDAIDIDRGETRRLVICAEALPSSYRLEPPAGIEVRYQQRLRRCGVGDNRPGLHLVLEANAITTGGEIAVTDTDTGARACDALVLRVPDRILLPAARLQRRGDALALDLRAPPGIDLAAACTGGLGFPEADGLTLEADPASPAPQCSRTRLQATVRALDARQQPAKILLPAVRLADGTVTGVVSYATAPPPRWLSAMAEADAKFIDVDGVRTRYFEGGADGNRRETLLLVHGGQPSSMDGTAWDWQQNFDGLAERFHVFALDRIGQGYTANPADLDEYRDYYQRVVTHLLGFMDAAGIRRAHLVGHSQGSWPVTRIALDHPQRVASLTLVDGTMVAPSLDGGTAVRFYLYLSQDLHPASGETLESARRGMELFSYTRNNLAEKRIARLLEMTRQPKYTDSQQWFARSGMSPAHPSFRALKAQLLGELEAGKLRVPVLVIWGNDDPEGSLASGLELFRIVSASSPRARLRVFGRSGHLPFVEYPEEFNRVLADFALGSSQPP